MSTEDIAFNWKPEGRNGVVVITVQFPGGDVFTDRVDVSDAEKRADFARAICEKRNGIDKDAVIHELERIAAERMDRTGRPSQADKLVALASDAELFHTPGNHDSEGYATVFIHGHKETWPISSKGFRRWLNRLYWERQVKVPGSQAVQDALNVLAGMAVHDGGAHPIAVRLAEQDGAIYLDLANPAWEVVEIKKSGWQVLSSSPVKFIRRRGMLALPTPIRGGNVNELRSLVNLRQDSAWVLYIAWLIAAFRPGRPFPVLCVNGEQGSAKSTLCKMARALIDPNEVPLRRPPREERDLMIAATNSWVVAFDNLSGVPPALSDALCSLATGGGFSTRELYTDGDEKLFNAVRPIMVNGIEDLATRGDLLDRAVTLTLQEIPENQRRDEDEVWREFEHIRPRVLGALLDAVSAALNNRPRIRLARKPRMADFATWIAAAEPALPWQSGQFLSAYYDNRNATNDLVLETSIIAMPIVSLVAMQSIWQGTVRELLQELETHHTDEKTRKRKEWPTSPRKLSGDLHRVAPNLRRSGIAVSFGGHTKKGTVVTIERFGPAPSPSSPSSSANTGKDLERDGSVTIGTDPLEDGEDRPSVPSRQNCVPEKGDDEGDDGDGVVQMPSADSEVWDRIGGTPNTCV